MCGFFAILDRDGRVALDHGAAAAMLAHRGPDHTGLGLYDLDGAALDGQAHAPAARAPLPARPHLALGHLRLSILDLDPRAHQPFESACGRYALAYNGEIYNYVELRETLRAEGRVFRTEGDTEVLLEAIAAWGPDRACRDAEGMFAFALLDRRAGTLIAGRDHLGIKPLFRAAWAGGWAWASEVWPLLGLPGALRAPRADRLVQYVVSGGQRHDDGGSFFAGIDRVAAGTLEEVALREGAPSARRFWRLARPARPTIPAAEATAAFRDAFLGSVRRHLRADVPLGVALSGGLDSSAIAGAIRHLEPDMPLETFSFLPETETFSEERWIDLCGTHLGARMHKVRPAAGDLPGDVTALIRAQGEPFGTTSIYAQFRVMRLAAAAGVKVMLDGQGADELLGGYAPYAGARAWSLARAGRPLAAWRLTGAAPGWAAASRRAILRDAALYALPRPWMRAARARVAARAPYGALFAPETLAAARLHAPGADPAALGWPAPGRERMLGGLLDEAVTVYGLPDLLRYEDRNSMHVSLESRVPFLTRTMAETCAALPEAALIDADGRPKAVLRDAMSGLIPDAIRDRRDKIGFRPDIARMNGPILDHVLGRRDALHLTPGIDWDAAFARLGAPDRDGVLAAPETWRLLNLALWSDAVARAPSLAREGACGTTGTPAASTGPRASGMPAPPPSDGRAA
ncbi:MAG: asparagine synthase (glutamine-hydrolyzing) [Shimia sp.]